MSDEKTADAYTDFIEPFLIDHSAIRGRFVRLSTLLDDILNAHHYPMAVSMHLAEQIVITCMLSATLVKDGILTVQAKGDGPVRFMVVDVMADGTVRGYAQMDEDALKQVIGKSKAKKHDIGILLGKGYLAVTLDDGKSKERYQGVVELIGESLSDAFKGYFMQSQQGEIALNIAVQPPARQGDSWKAGGVIVERMPIAGGKQVEMDIDEQDEIWERTKLFMQTLKPKEMLDRRITPQSLLYRLFNEDGVWYKSASAYLPTPAPP